MRETRSSGSVEGVMGNCDSYSDLPRRWSRSGPLALSLKPGGHLCDYACNG